MNHKEFCHQMAKEAGAIMLEYFYGENKVSYKDGKELVTEADIKINDLLIEKSKQYFPEYGVYGEEVSYQQEKNYLRCCDPIDGTIPYVHGIKTSCFSLALLEDGEPIIGCIYQPFLYELYYAEIGGGAYCNNVEITVSQALFGDQGVLLGLAYFPIVPFSLESLRHYVASQNILHLDLATSTYMGCLVAAGKLEGLLFPSDKPFDCAAVKVLVEEAGGKETSLFGEAQLFNQPIQGNIISNGVVHDELLALVKKYVSRK